MYVDVNFNNVIDHGDRVGFLTFNTGIIYVQGQYLAAGAGVRYLDVIEGRMQVALNSPIAFQAAERIHELRYESNALRTAFSSDVHILELFAEGHALFTVHLFHLIERYMRDMEDGFYIVPLPKLDRNQSYYMTSTHDNMGLFAISAWTTNVRAVTYTLERMAFWAWYLVTPVYFNDALVGFFAAGSAEYETVLEMLELSRAGLSRCLGIIWGRPTPVFAFFRSSNLSQATGVIQGRVATWQRSYINPIIANLDHATAPEHFQR